MKPVNFFSKFAAICNLCFVLFVIFNILEKNSSSPGAVPGTVEKLPFFKELIIILGFSSIIVSFLICLVYLILVLKGKMDFIPKWLGMANVIFLFIEVYYFFLT